MAKDEQVRKITISLPEHLVEFADEEAERSSSTRSAFIAHALAEIKAEKEEQLAADGYRFYAAEALDFAEESAGAIAEALKHGG